MIATRRKREILECSSCSSSSFLGDGGRVWLDEILIKLMIMRAR